MPADKPSEDTRARLNLETAPIRWRELQTYFARGQVVFVSEALDLLSVGEALTADNKAQFEQWMASGAVGEVPVDRAQSWYDADAELWAVVIAPWVLIQDRNTRN
ncbi:MAG: hypothetical protein CL581_07190 [Alteromonadaceae bacterium]|uniref:DUF2288 domain-containing protein n=1 Tax=unclassified Marinobacter TaxID=83889 RepID=UPI000C6796BA|nr:DUF2288 domain-containing protein [Marinobacter sp. BGYM27]MAA64544.1 hypothetical protein [Alteromonadaceae bacterium]MBH84764.1 hypothetical protein [Alteromonadaceae bacterium]MDG5501504.1 DUF2288 domain-containing protein [Marinobacter sp. BGYM27]|tara:strand:- start:220 stop:534 length:315 start_codon:yes stop_codon:yes gene_type:complete